MIGTRSRPVVALWLLYFHAITPAHQSGDQEAQLNLIVKDGQGAINNIRQRSGQGIAVRVENERHEPLAGVPVVFTLPSDGPGGEFSNGEKTIVVTTSPEGLAVSTGPKPNKLTGKFDIRVTASYQGLKSSAVITQFNMAVQNGGSSKGGKWIYVLLAAGGAGAAGAVFAARGGASKPGPVTPAPVVISLSPGSGSVGPPQ